jgi:protein-tyrosine phosphatase
MMVDLHCHVLPAIDDGCESLEQSLEFCRVALEDGVTTLVATPHQKPGQYENSPEAIRQKVVELRAALQEADIAVEILEGAEVYHTLDLMTRLRERRVTTLGATGRYLLLELPFQQMPLRVEESVFQLKLGGITPVLAHPERINYFVADMERLEKMVRLGCLCQVTGAALLGGFGDKVRDYSMRMLERNLVHVISSDAHDTVYRPPVLARASEKAAEVVGAERATQMVTDVPRAICRGLEWEPWELPPEPAAPSPGVLGRLRSLFRGRT